MSFPISALQIFRKNCKICITCSSIAAPDLTCSWSHRWLHGLNGKISGACEVVPLMGMKHWNKMLSRFIVYVMRIWWDWARKSKIRARQRRASKHSQKSDFSVSFSCLQKVNWFESCRFFVFIWSYQLMGHEKNEIKVFYIGLKGLFFNLMLYWTTVWSTYCSGVVPFFMWELSSLFSSLLQVFSFPLKTVACCTMLIPKVFIQPQPPQRFHSAVGLNVRVRSLSGITPGVGG